MVIIRMNSFFGHFQINLNYYYFNNNYYLCKSFTYRTGHHTLDSSQTFLTWLNLNMTIIQFCNMIRYVDEVLSFFSLL